MQYRKSFSRVFVIAVAVFSAVFNAHSDDMFVWAEESEGNTIFYFEGSIDLAGFPTVNTAFSLNRSIRPVQGFYFSGSSPSVPVDSYEGVMPGKASQEYGSGVDEQSFADSDSGDDFGFTSSGISLPVGYVSGTRISGSMTFEGETFSSLGVDTTPRSFDTTVGGNTIHLFRRPGSVDPINNNAITRARLQRKIKAIKKKIKRLKRLNRASEIKRLNKKVRKLRKRIRRL